MKIIAVKYPAVKCNEVGLCLNGHGGRHGTNEKNSFKYYYLIKLSLFSRSVSMHNCISNGLETHAYLTKQALKWQ